MVASGANSVSLGYDWYELSQAVKSRDHARQLRAAEPKSAGKRPIASEPEARRGGRTRRGKRRNVSTSDSDAWGSWPATAQKEPQLPEAAPGAAPLPIDVSSSESDSAAGGAAPEAAEAAPPLSEEGGADAAGNGGPSSAAGAAEAAPPLSEEEGAPPLNAAGSEDGPRPPAHPPPFHCLAMRSATPKAARRPPLPQGARMSVQGAITFSSPMQATTWLRSVGRGGQVSGEPTLHVPHMHVCDMHPGTCKTSTPSPSLKACQPIPEHARRAHPAHHSKVASPSPSRTRVERDLLIEACPHNRSLLPSSSFFFPLFSAPPPNAPASQRPDLF